MNHFREFAGSMAVSCVLAAPASALAGDDFKGEVRDAWLEGKIETTYTLNEHLNPFDIDTEVRDSTAYLAGMVDSDIDRDLAAELALAVDGVAKVENNIAVKDKFTLFDQTDESSSDHVDARRSFAQIVDDATTTAAIKSKLAINGNVKARDINIDTRNDVVVLSGTVDSEQQKSLAGKIALNASDTEEVRNELKVRGDS